MSYIRCLSNPEGLYVWSDSQKTTIAHTVKPPHSSGRYFTVPHKAFDRVLKLWAQYHEPARCGGVTAEELHIDRKTGAVIPPSKPCNRGCQRIKNGWIPCRPCWKKQTRDARHAEFFIRLSYKDDFVNMWRVTWDYMTNRFKGEKGK